MRQLESDKIHFEKKNATFTEKHLEYTNTIQRLKTKNEELEKKIPVLGEEQKKLAKKYSGLQQEYKKISEELEQVGKYSTYYNNMQKECNKFFQLFPKDEKSNWEVS